jgi:hypothetical protein
LEGIYQYLFKLGVLFNIPWMHVLCHRFIEWRPHEIAKKTLMEKIDVLEFMRIPRRHEKIIQSSRNSLFSVTTKVHENEHRCVSNMKPSRVY